MSQAQRAQPLYDAHELKHSLIPTWLGLVFFSCIGAITVIEAGTGGAGFVAVPVWGTVFGLFGLRRAARSTIKQAKVKILDEHHVLTRFVHMHAQRLGLPHMPRVGTMPANNAYAIGSGWKDSLVVIGEPLLEILDVKELGAIVGHELGHIANNDMRRMAFARSFQSALTWFGMNARIKAALRWVLMTFSELGVLRLSRKREYWADAIGAALTSKEAMIGALHKLHNEPLPFTSFEKREARMMFRGIGGSIWSTHPTLEERVEALVSGKYTSKLQGQRTANAQPRQPEPRVNSGY